MTPGARIAAAIEILDRITAGAPAEKVLVTWARRSRFAGARDRAAVRDLVFDVLRRRRSCAARGGGESGRALLIGLLRERGEDPAALFTGEGHAPPPLAACETTAGAPPEGAAALDIPDWMLPAFEDSLGNDMAAVCRILRERAPVWLRVNTARCTRDEAARLLADEGIATRPSDHVDTALQVTENERRTRNSRAYRQGLAELQDLHSQALCRDLPLAPGARVLDYCAGGGGKVLALAARQPRARYFAHDAAPRRMRDLPTRARRAGADIQLLSCGEASGRAPFDLVLCDVPCSGSGAWRRSPEGKWRLDRPELERLMRMQVQILEEAKILVSPGGVLAYATCSLLRAENEARIKAFLAANPGWVCHFRRRYSPLRGGDGFFLAQLGRKQTI